MMKYLRMILEETPDVCSPAQAETALEAGDRRTSQYIQIQ
jgi:hypothetical protein